MYPSMCQEVVPCGEVRKALTTQECDANEGMAQFQQCLSLENLSLEVGEKWRETTPSSTTVVPCSELLEALTTQTCDASEVVAQFQQSLSLENLSSEQPDPDTKKKVKTANRPEVVEKWRKTTPSSTTVIPCGELLEALTTQTCDASEVVAQFQQSLSLENLSLEQPDPETKKKVKREVVEKWRKTISASTTVHNNQAIVLRGEVLEALTSQTCDASEVVAQFQQSLFLENLSLEQPDHDTKKKIRYLCLKAKTANKPEVVKKLREITPAGTTGPLLPEEYDVVMIPLCQREELTMSLCAGDDWKVLAESLGLTSTVIKFFDKRYLNPCDAVLDRAREKKLIQSVGDLYDRLVDCEFPVLADLL